VKIGKKWFISTSDFREAKAHFIEFVSDRERRLAELKEELKTRNLPVPPEECERRKKFHAAANEKALSEIKELAQKKDYSKFVPYYNYLRYLYFSICPKCYKVIERSKCSCGFETVSSLDRPSVYTKSGDKIVYIPKEAANTSTPSEDAVQETLAKRLGGKREILCRLGRIDVLTGTEIIEVKNWKLWMDGVGQLLRYQLDYPKHKLRLVLFGKEYRYPDREATKEIENTVNDVSMKVSWYERDFPPSVGSSEKK
jgi:hypothetical protein